MKWVKLSKIIDELLLDNLMNEGVRKVFMKDVLCKLMRYKYYGTNEEIIEWIKNEKYFLWSNDEWEHFWWTNKEKMKSQRDESKSDKNFCWI